MLCLTCEDSNNYNYSVSTAARVVKCENRKIIVYNVVTGGGGLVGRDDVWNEERGGRAAVAVYLDFFFLLDERK